MKRQSCKFERFATQKGSEIKKIAFVLTFGFHGSQWQRLMSSHGPGDGELGQVVSEKWLTQSSTVVEVDEELPRAQGHHMRHHQH
jgi:hypothetical protein